MCPERIKSTEISHRLQSEYRFYSVFVIIIYVIFHIFTYFTSNPVSEYEVQQGTIATNNIYKGMIIREESVVYAEESGNLNYFVSNGSKVATSDVVYSVDTDGSIATQITGAQMMLPPSLTRMPGRLSLT